MGRRASLGGRLSLTTKGQGLPDPAATSCCPVALPPTPGFGGNKLPKCARPTCHTSPGAAIPLHDSPQSPVTPLRLVRLCSGNMAFPDP